MWGPQFHPETLRLWQWAGAFFGPSFGGRGGAGKRLCPREQGCVSERAGVNESKVRGRAAIPMHHKEWLCGSK